MQISDHFWRSEFACKCGCGRATVDAVTLRVAEKVRGFVGGPVSINSGFRCFAHNRKVGGAENSQHLTGMAADLAVKDPAAVAKYLDDMYPDQFGIGTYGTFVHFDARTNRARWTG